MEFTGVLVSAMNVFAGVSVWNMNKPLAALNFGVAVLIVLVSLGGY